MQAKLAALLDDVTVGNGRATQPNNPVVPAAGPQSTTHAANDAPTVPGSSANPTAHTLNATAEVAQIAAQIKSIQAAAERLGAEPPKPPSPPLTNGAVTIRGRGDGVAIELGKGTWPELLEQLRERLAQAANFFRGASVALDIGARPLLESELGQVRTLLTEHEMRLALVRTGDERTFEAAIALGLAAKLLASDGSADAEIEVADANVGTGRYFVYYGNLRSGQVLERREHILVLGDVNPGAAVISHGDILVWGRMRGIAHAGASGDRQSLILALQLAPIQLHIAGLVAIEEQPAPRSARRWGRKAEEKRPEVAHLAGEQVVIEPWDESKPGGLAAFRR
jgi:septum site-determining protein MinC